MKAEHCDLLESLRPARTVVVVDDHPSFRRCASALLAAEGFEVVGEAADGASALSAAELLEPDFVVLDIQLPDIDGFEVARRLLAARPELPIILVSSRDRSQYGSLIEASGVRGFVAKAELSGALLERLLE
jgi:DNA-binding NarL/FixJ family response regulator